MTRGNPPRGRVAVSLALLFGVLGPLSVVRAAPAAAAGPCGPPVVSVIACENSLPGDPMSDWQVSGAGDPTIQGFATSMSVNKGQTVQFKVSTSASSYHFDVLRLGYYQGNGARIVAAGLRPTATLPQTQPTCLSDASTGLVDCGNWAVSASWTVPQSAVSGVYIAHLVRDDTHGDSQITFVVRDDSSHSDLIYQTSDTTWQAYNTYGGNSLYTCTAACPAANPPEGYKAAYKVSYNRPFTATADSGRASVFYAEFPMIRFLEANGYDVTYMSGGDVDSRGSLLLNHKAFLSTGHDEYWSGNQRANVEAARNAGVSLAFFSGNESFWKTRWEPSIDGTNSPERTLVSYKETHFDAQVDPQGPAIWTGTWRDPRFSPPADGGRPENALTGQFFIVNSGTTDIQVPAAYGKLRFWRNTAVATLPAGQTLTLGAGSGTLGYEWDEDVDNGFRPAGLLDMSSTTLNVPQAFTDYGSNVAAAPATHHLTLFRAPSGALTFGAGTVQWTWGLDSTNDSGKPPDPNMQQATVNLFADMGAQPSSLISGLTAATKSSDTAPPTSIIGSPAAGTNVADGATVTVSGTATDTGGGVVAGVEVSTDGGTTWHPASGTNNWTYTWVVHNGQGTTVRSRAVDDSGNLEAPSAGVAVNASCPCSIWGPNVAPSTPDSADPASVEVGVKFKADVFGTVSGIRFYKANTNTGTHIGNLWTSSGQLVASATFTNETASGWQQVNFPSPVPIVPNATYVASYFAPAGHYSATENYFYPQPAPSPVGGGIVDSPPLHALGNGASGSNGVFMYGSTSAFPTGADNETNYWVDVAFAPASGAGQATNVTATAGYASAGLTWAAPTTGGPVMTYIVTPFIGTNAQTPVTVTGTPARTSTVVSGLTNETAYSFTVTASNPAGTGLASAASNVVTPSTSVPVVANGGFETGLNSWTTGGVAVPTTTNAKSHTGSASAVLGTPSGAEPNGDSSISQTITVPAGTSTVSFWYLPVTADALCSGSACTFDWQEAQIRNASGATLASLFKSNSNSQTWTEVTFNTSPYAGQAIVLWFNVHGDGSNPPDDTSMYLDDVAVTATGAPTVPAAPTNVSATAGDKSAVVNWTAAANGGSPITSYTITPFVGLNPQPGVLTNGTATTFTVTGLTNGASYTFTVAATNGVGIGPASLPSNTVTPTGPTVPGAPTAVSATAGNASAVVSWTAPANGGSPISGYTITPYVGPNPQPGVPSNGTATTFTVTGLTNGASYTFTVAATNGVGPGPASLPSNTVTATGPTVPGAPTAVSATAGNASAVVSWTAPANGGSPISGYMITPYVGSNPQPSVPSNGTATTFIVTGLTNGTSYTFTVTATNGVGPGPASSQSNSVTPTAPAGPVVDSSTSVTGTGSISASVSTPAPGDVLLAFVSSDGPPGGGQTATVSGAGLTWSLVARTNTQPGTSEIWSARAQGILSQAAITSSLSNAAFFDTLTVVAFSGASGTGAVAKASAASGAPSATLTTIQTGSWVFGVGNDWDNATARTLGPNQTMVNQTVYTAGGDTFWVQRQNVTTAASGAAVAINDTAPTGDRWNLTTVEVLAGTPPPPPPPPVISQVTASGITATSATVTWTTDQLSTSQVDYGTTSTYTSSSPLNSSPLTTHSVTLSNLTAVTTYHYRVDSGDNSGVTRSADAVFTTAPTAVGPTIDSSTSATGPSPLSASVSTATAGDLLVAFVSSDGPAGGGQTATLSGGGLTWSLVGRTNTQLGTAEIWSAPVSGTLNQVPITSTLSSAHQELITVVAFSGAPGTGAVTKASGGSGAPSATLTTTQANSWVFGVGDDWDNAIARTVGANQTMVNQNVYTAGGDTFWVQQQNSPAAAAGTAVTLNDTAPSGDRWNFTIVEIL